jgi:hypothetical protein
MVMKQIIPVPTTLHIEAFSGANISEMSSYIENGIIEEYADGKKYVTQRPSFTTIESAAVAGVDNAGRGIYYWRLANKLYIANYDTIYVDTYGVACTGVMPAAGSHRLYFAELGTYLFLLDTEGNAAYVTTAAAPTVWALVSDADFPDATISRTLADGVAILDNTLYVLANADANNQAEVWGSDLLNPSSWAPTNFIAAYKNPDKGVYIGKHHNNIFVLGNESVEFFYNAGNPTGSPLSPKQDLSYNIGCADGRSVFIDNDEVFFVGKSTTSGLGVFKMSNFEIQKISSSSFDSFLNSAITISGMAALGSGLFAGGKTFYVLTLYSTEADTSSVDIVVPQETFVFNNKTGTWSFWEHSRTTYNEFPLVQWVVANDVSGLVNNPGKGIMSNGDYIECFDDFIPQDRERGVTVFESGVFEDGVFADVSDTGDIIRMKIQVPHIDFGTRNRKFMHYLRPICDATSSTQTLLVRTSDDVHSPLSTARTLNLSNSDDKLTRWGQFRSRNFYMEYEGSEIIRLEGLEVEVGEALV